MFSFPKDYEQGWTLRNEIKKDGIGLHSGLKCRVVIKPTQLAGFHFSFSDDPQKVIPIDISQVRNTPLCTTLDLKGKKISTVEHLLAALIGAGLTHVHIEINGNEIPLLDGSAIGWIEEIEKVGMINSTTSPRPRPEITSPVVVNRGESVIFAIPSKKLKLIGSIDFSYKAIGQQIFSIELSPNNFVKEIAPARTFGFLDQLEELKKAGLIKGGALENALVCNGDSWINPPLRFANEPVRHKLLDLIGDLAFVGLPKAQIFVYKGSHALHAEFAASIQKVLI
ncbi:UDP-3-O-acyl-N-acetylglucosamine deacetylase [Prochlorococcus marinus]|uniref:UDP-3-O-acyl-N-acetylglucosamine deacetylase n=1 Tax=Prochlorococcus marinus XMU1408 TaxID=2213228 RepID=A0A318R7D7_PROMR|nr:UDP-3-O-acyl-N-acetylglucosamine deacetylase [Prochlorococcus marinus]MBW3042521.1 UDP-3-O-acyl-N-acetylglucosamine deacetylase [Prochlorococcus marinus str. XMU1408]PYE01248.1 UDP-3-O-acyl-N-acetylglucosamine deacetylase [Prochlorococcus marinus XMU1408]